MVTKSAVRNTLATPLRSSNARTQGSSGSDPLRCVPGPPTGSPTVNFVAFGFGVGSTLTAMLGEASGL